MESLVRRAFVKFLYFSVLCVFLSSFSSSLSHVKLNSIPKHIFCDMDGTLLRSDSHTLSDRTKLAVKEVIKQGVNFFPATGRTRSSLTRCLCDEFLSLYGGRNKLAGVYQQGLMVYDTSGNIIYERFMDPDIVGLVEDFCARAPGVPSVVGYAEKTIHCQQRTQHMDVFIAYGDPEPVVYSQGLRSLRLSGVGFHKLIILHEQSVLDEVRPMLAELLAGVATLTQAVSGMLEVLPYGASKGDGVKKFLEHFDYSKDDILVFGDGENDIEMFELASLSIAVENAKEKVKSAADFVVPSNNEDGVAQVLEKLIHLKIKPMYV